MTAPRWGIAAAVAALVVIEYLALSVMFDAQALLDGAGWGSALARLGRIGPVFLAIPVAALLLRRDALARAWRSAAQARPIRATAALVAAHLAAFAGVVLATRHVIATAPPTAAATALWVVIAAAWLALAVAAVMPLRSLVAFARAAAGPIAVGVAVGLAAWGAGLATELLYDPMATATMHVAHGVLGLMADGAYIEPAERIIATDRFWVEIAPVCAGYEGIGVVAVFLGAFLYASRASLRFPHALALVPLAVAMVWVLNAVRIAVLVVIGDRISADVALAGFHSKAGWIAVCAVALVGAFVARQSRWFALDPVARGEIENPTAAYLVPLLAMIAASMVTGALAVGVDVLYPVRIAAGVGALWLYRRYYRDELGAGAWSWTGLATGAAFGAAAFALWIALEPAPDPAAVAAARVELELAGPLGVAYVVTRAVGSVALVPVVEELAFRGYLLRRLAGGELAEVDRRRFAPLAFAVSSVAFGLLHQRWLAGTLAGMVFALAVYWRGRLADAVVAHAVANALIAVAVLGLGWWGLWL